MSIDRDVELKILKDRNNALEERDRLRQIEIAELRLRLNELRSLAPQDLMDLINEKNDRIEELDDRCRDLVAASIAVMKAYEHSYCSDDQRAAIRTIRAVIDDSK
jgi:hypothetical protein